MCHESVFVQTPRVIRFDSDGMFVGQCFTRYCSERY